MISTTAEYALRAMVYLAGEPRTARTTQQIAQATMVPASYLSKVLQALGRAELVRSVRGIHGGYQLQRSARQISVLDVINSVDPLRRIQRCPLGLKEHQQLCPLHNEVDAAIARTETAFARTPISSLLLKSNTHTQCLFPEHRPARRRQNHKIRTDKVLSRVKSR
ncbi:MAG: HTH-type transcriptional repressor NsrR [Phycisphaerae bacterium]|nr:HTH-type transcriptional repressor NsrR [Phycisphaerae bacterium]